MNEFLAALFGLKQSVGWESHHDQSIGYRVLFSSKLAHGHSLQHFVPFSLKSVSWQTFLVGFFRWESWGYLVVNFPKSEVILKRRTVLKAQLFEIAKQLSIICLKLLQLIIQRFYNRISPRDSEDHFFDLLGMVFTCCTFSLANLQNHTKLHCFKLLPTFTWSVMPVDIAFQFFAVLLHDVSWKFWDIFAEKLHDLWRCHWEVFQNSVPEFRPWKLTRNSSQPKLPVSFGAK